MVRLGIENLLSDRRDLVAGKRVGLITNPSGVDSELTPTIDRLHNADGIDLVRLFGPEHGIRGSEQAGVKIEDTIDEKTGLPVKSLYGDNRRLQPEHIADLDVVVYDMQDIGCRFYTLIYTLAYALEGAAEAGKRIVVLDRPNPIAPIEAAGNRVMDNFTSFVGDYALPVVHGMTVGELARYFNREFDVGADLEVVELAGWNKDVWYDDTDLPWVHPSPNMPTLTTATVYPGTCFFEGTTLSEGRGTTKPFELIGAPWVDAEVWARRLNSFDLPGVGFRPTYFTPMFSKHEREDLEGVHVHVLDRDAYQPVRTGLTMLVSAFLDFDGEADWVETNDSYVVDRLAGGDYLRETIEDCTDSADPIEIVDGFRDTWEAELAEFRDVRLDHELYA